VVVEGSGDCRDRRGANVSGWLRSQAWRRRRSDRDDECSRQRGTRNEEMRNVEGNESGMSPNE